MSNATMLEGTGKSENFNPEVVENVSNHVRKVACTGEWRELHPAVSLTEIVKYVSQALSDLVSMRGTTVPVSDSDIEGFLFAITNYRVLQLGRKLPRGVIAQDVPVPDFFRPVLASICNYEDPLRALSLKPVWESDCRKGEAEDKPEGMISDSLMPFDRVLRVARLLKGNGVRMTYGLPRELSTGDDAIFRVCEDSEGNLLVAGSDVGEAELLIRSVVRIQFLSEVFGAARTRYVSVEDLRTAWDAVVNTGF